MRVFQQTGPEEWGSYPGSSKEPENVWILARRGADAALVTEALRGWYPALTAPPGTPPSWVFAPVWTTLYVMIGVAGWLVWRRPSVAAVGMAACG